MDEIFNTAIKDRIFSRAVVLTATPENIIGHKAFGGALDQTVQGGAELNATFELGSLTRALCTSLSMVILTSELNLNLNSPAAKYLPEFNEEGKEKITLKQLLKHTSGLTATRPYINDALSREDILEKIYYEELDFPPAFERKTSDLGYIVLGAIVERLSGLSLDKFFAEKIARPLGLVNTRFTPLGHTGLVSTTEDCWRIASAIVSCYAETGNWLPKSVLDEFIGPKVRYKLGFDTAEPPFSTNTIGMSSNTGCTLWIDLERNFILEIFTDGGEHETVKKWLPQAYMELLKDVPLPTPGEPQEV